MNFVFNGTTSLFEKKTFGVLIKRPEEYCFVTRARDWFDFFIENVLNVFKRRWANLCFFQNDFFFFKFHKNQDDRVILCLVIAFLLITNEITRVAGIEPTHMVLKTIVLPLNYTP